MLIHDQTLPRARVLHTSKLLLLAGLLAACVVPEASASPGTVKQASVEGALDKPAVREVVKAHIVEVRDCYNAELGEDGTVAGRVVVSFVVQPDGSASKVGVSEFATLTDHTARIWRSDGTLIAVLEGHAEMESVTWSPDGSRLVSTSLDHVARIWRADGAAIATLSGHEGEITSVVWSSDNTRLLTTTGNGIDGAARLWTAEGLLLATIPHTAGIASGTFGPADTHVLAAGRDGNVRMWLVDAAQLLRGFWLSTPRCLDALTRQRVLAETPADAQLGEDACRAMQACLRDQAGAIDPEHFEPCLAELHAGRNR